MGLRARTLRKKRAQEPSWKHTDGRSIQIVNQPLAKVDGLPARGPHRAQARRGGGGRGGGGGGASFSLCPFFRGGVFSFSPGLFLGGGFGGGGFWQQITNLAHYDARPSAETAPYSASNWSRKLERTRRGERLPAYIDIEGNSRASNDSLGHPAGDER